MVQPHVCAAEFLEKNMIQLICRLWIRQDPNTADPEVRARFGMAAGIVGILSNLLLAVLKMLIGVIFGAIAIVADGINNLSDSVSSVLTLIGFRLSAQKADADHPYGHGRMEYITTLFIAIMMILVGFSLVRESFPKIFRPEEAHYTWLVYATLVLSIAIKLWQGLFYRKMGKLIKSETLMANFRDSINDVLSTGAVLISIGITRLIGYNTDGLMGSFVALFIMYSGAVLAKETIQPLLGEGADPELAARIEAGMLRYDGVIGVHDLTVHNYGPGRMFASAHAEVPAERDVLESHDVIDNIERELSRELGLHLTIHLDPVVTNDPELVELKYEVRQILNTYGEELKFHDLRLVRGTTHTNVLFDVVVPFGFSVKDEELLKGIDAALKANHPDYFTVVGIDREFIKKL